MAPRSSQGEWEPASDRSDPVGCSRSRPQPGCPSWSRSATGGCSCRRSRSSAAPPIMAADLADAPRTGLEVQLCGDAHLSNFGVFAAPDRRLVFSINDFDETLPGPFEWDVKRLVASFAVAGRDRGFDASSAQVDRARRTRSYREAMRGFAGMRNIDVWYTRLDIDEILALCGTAGDRQAAERPAQPGEGAHQGQPARRRQADRDGRREPRFVSDPPLIMPIEDLADGATEAELEEFTHGAIRAYRRTLPRPRRLLERYRYVDMARKVVGVGSVGTRAWICCCSAATTSDPLVLQAQGGPGVGPRAVPGREPVREPRSARRRGPAADAGGERHPARLEPHPGLDGVNATSTSASSGTARARRGRDDDPPAMTLYASMCGWTLARAHARSGDPVAIASTSAGATFDRAMASSPSATPTRTSSTTGARRRDAGRGETTGASPTVRDAGQARCRPGRRPARRPGSARRCGRGSRHKRREHAQRDGGAGDTWPTPVANAKAAAECRRGTSASSASDVARERDVARQRSGRRRVRAA